MVMMREGAGAAAGGGGDGPAGPSARAAELTNKANPVEKANRDRRRTVMNRAALMAHRCATGPLGADSPCRDSVLSGEASTKTESSRDPGATNADRVAAKRGSEGVAKGRRQTGDVFRECAAARNPEDRG